MDEPGTSEDSAVVQGDYVRISASALDEADGNPPFGQVGKSLPVGGLLVVQAGAGLGVFAPEDLHPVSPADIPSEVLADIVRRTGLMPPDTRSAP
ncbi:hypothetical protein [Blastococcus goldschmidtiae]|uniref:Uncharacterized protein n=1 Tax=Blastococcus goldschmidtiae TaxID=3075546 RepID=A0ABU2K4X7_9ACTN|nr:hypothetical protein [Blastococcus sp. DSM 46792]MDT0275247.1 hypothetical protein [Blastococcus sp. DSM 46792]